jgi:peptide deformylase
MAVREIVKYPHEVLQGPAGKVEKIDDRIRALVDDMAKTMYAAPGLGLAAPQIGVPLQVIVMDVTPQEETEKNLIALINPEIVGAEGEVESKEGCLSVADVTCEIRRYARVRVRGLSLEGKPVEMDIEGLLAIVVQHEVDHLRGRLIFDHLSTLKRDLLKRKLRKRAET